MCGCCWLQEALAHASEVRGEARRALARHGVSTPLVELLNLATVAEITVACALQRRESRGGHFCVDYPQQVCMRACIHVSLCVCNVPLDLRFLPLSLFLPCLGTATVMCTYREPVAGCCEGQPLFS